MKFAVIGSGGVGGYFGGRLAQAGENVVFLARGAHLSALREKGLRVQSTEGDFEIPRVTATDDIGAIEAVDIAILAVKSWQVRELAPLLPPLLREGGAVLTLQNGVEAPDEVAAECGAERVIAGVCRIMTYLAEPGLIRHQGVNPRLEFGELLGGASERASALQAAFNRCQGVSAAVSRDIQAALWEKFLFIAPFSAVGAVTRKPAGAWRRVSETRALLAQAMEEVVQLSRARGVNLAEDAAERTLQFVDRLPEGSTASMQRDLLDGKPSELEAQTGAIVRLAAAASVETPANRFLYAALLPSERQARGL